MTFVSILVKVSVVLSVVAVTQIVLAPRMSAAMRHLVWTLALAGVLLLPPLAAGLPEWSAVQYAEPAGVSPVFQPIVPSAATPAREVGLSAAAGRRIAWPSLWPAFYLTAVALLLARIVLQHVQTARLVRAATPIVEAQWLDLFRECAVRLGVRRPVRLLRAADDRMPMAAGVRRACIVLPAAADTWPADRRRAVLLHELAHVERHDCLTQTLAAVACAAYWVHPGVWWIARRLRAERELACDDRVLSAGENARDYAGHLLELAYALGTAARPSAAVTMARPRELEGRMLAVLDAARNRAIPALRSRFVGVAALAALTVPVAAATITPPVHDLRREELTRATQARDAGISQAPAQGRPRFEVATIKRTPDDTGPGADFAVMAGGRLHVRNNAVTNLIGNAYGVPGYLLIGGREWIRADRYDIEAKAASEPPRSEMMLMLQALLEDRFRLRTHRETRDMPAYVLTVVRGGARLTPSKPGSCIEVDRSRPNAPPPPLAPGETRLRSCGNSNLSERVRPPNLTWTANHLDSRAIAETLSVFFRRPVVDRSGLAGFYDIQIDLPPLAPVAAADPAALDTSPSVFTVLQEQLGLRVEEGRGPVEVLVIDRVERPTPN
jgi:uncharacterized protein (TIGR03435 family)